MSNNSKQVTPDSTHAEVAKNVVAPAQKYFDPSKGTKDGELTKEQQAITDAAIASQKDAAKIAAERVKLGLDQPAVKLDGDN